MPPGSRIPGYIAGRGALLAAGAAPVPVTSDSEGLDVAAGIERAPDARLALVAPSHATPLGGALPIGRRLALLDWAGRANAWVLEDDCDSEFRWSGHPLPPLATLDRAGRVIYCGTFSKTLAPALRLGFAVVPAPLVPAFVRLGTLMDRGIDTLNQAILAEFMRQGLLAPHVRRMRTEYARRRAALLAAIAQHAPSIAPIPAPGGLHMVGRLPDGIDEAAAVQACRARGLAVSPLAAYYAGAPRMAGLVMGFAGTPDRARRRYRAAAGGGAADACFAFERDDRTSVYGAQCKSLSRSGEPGILVVGRGCGGVASRSWCPTGPRLLRSTREKPPAREARIAAIGHLFDDGGGAIRRIGRAVGVAPRSRVGELGDRTPDFGFERAAIEVVSSEVVMRRAVV